jgi:hypothetical protein
MKLSMQKLGNTFHCWLYVPKIGLDRKLTR